MPDPPAVAAVEEGGIRSPLLDDGWNVDRQQLTSRMRMRPSTIVVRTYDERAL